MAACRIVYQPVFDAVDSISKAKEKYDTAAGEFISAFHTAIGEMEGAAKDALLASLTRISPSLFRPICPAR